ncbi:hypothetical protein ACIQZB_40660 [Streptomyces sp. NPDC097727]|uniref:hypothetical protein n=1 Tax=Streptomyces sp. NPDC097727 TaxID=3366092 RepID=UPI00380187F2
MKDQRAGGEFRRARPSAQIPLTHMPDPRAFGVTELDAGDTVIALEGEPEHLRSELALVAVHLLGPAVHEAVRAIRPSGRDKLEMAHALQYLISAPVPTCGPR